MNNVFTGISAKIIVPNLLLLLAFIAFLAYLGLDHRQWTEEHAETHRIAYQAALEKALPYDLAIVDLTVPGGMGGQKTVEKLRQLAPEARVIVSSGYARDPVLANYEQYGFAGKIAKPIAIRTLATTVKRVLNGEKEVFLSTQ